MRLKQYGEEHTIVTVGQALVEYVMFRYSITIFQTVSPSYIITKYKPNILLPNLEGPISNLGSNMATLTEVLFIFPSVLPAKGCDSTST
jgi:hypothetical protein